jgi:lysozyme family protein
MNTNFDACLTHTLKYEGGYVDHPADPGGATNLGITLATLRAWRDKPVSKVDVRALTKSEAGAIYRNKYWNAVRGDDLPKGVDLVVFDWGVNSGPNAAIKALQKVVGVTPDGYIGAVTLREVAKANPATLIKTLCDRRGSFFQSLKTFKVFGRGWMRRVTEVRTAALKMIGA